MARNDVFKQEVVPGEILTTAAPALINVVHVSNVEKKVILNIDREEFYPSDLRELGWTLLHMANVLEDKVLVEPPESS